MTDVVGIDVSKAKLDCLWLRDHTTLKVKTKVMANDNKGHQALCQWLPKTLKLEPAQILVVMEATGIYHEKVALTLHDAGFRVAVVNPAHIKAYAQSLGNTHKTDKQDSLIIARFGAERDPAAESDLHHRRDRAGRQRSDRRQQLQARAARQRRAHHRAALRRSG